MCPWLAVAQLVLPDATKPWELTTAHAVDAAQRFKKTKTLYHHTSGLAESSLDDSQQSELLGIVNVSPSSEKAM